MQDLVLSFSNLAGAKQWSSLAWVVLGELYLLWLQWLPSDFISCYVNAYNIKEIVKTKTQHHKIQIFVTSVSSMPMDAYQKKLE